MANNRELSQFANVVGYDGGNIGIGTDNPLQKLHLFDTTSSNIYLQTHNSGTGSTAGVYFRTSDSSTADGFFKTAIVLEDDGTSWARGKLHILQDNTADASNATLDDSVLTINQSGNIGINETNPIGDLSITGANGSSMELQPDLVSGTNRITNYNRSTSTYKAFRLDASQHEFLISGSEKLRITSDGKMGLGETTPLGLLHVKSGDSGATSVGASADEFVIEGSANAGMTILSGTSGEGLLNFADSGDVNVGSVVYNHSDNSMRFKTADSERLRINSAGNIGIKETSPACSLHVDGGTDNLIGRFESSDAGAKIELKDNHATSSIEQNSNEFIFNSDSGAADGSSRMTFKIDNSEAMRIDSSGRLLLGTTDDGYSSADNFTIADTGNCGLTIRSGTSSLGTIAFSDATSGTGEYSGYIQYNQANRHLTFGTESDDHVRIDNNGHLEVDYDSDNNARVQFGFATGIWITGNSSDGHQRFYTNQAERIRSGYNGQGTEFSNQNSVRPGADNSIDLGSGSYRYDDVYATNGTIQTSDSRLKQEVVTSVLGIDFIKALRPVSYKWIEGKKVPIVDGTDENGDNIYRSDADGNWVYNSRAGARRHWGFIAQEVKQVVDDAGVDFAGWSLADKDDSNSTQSLRYEEFIAPLTKALQEAIAKIETLETQNADLLARVTALEGS